MTENVRKFHPNKSGVFGGAACCLFGLYLGFQTIFIYNIQKSNMSESMWSRSVLVMEQAILFTLWVVGGIAVLLFLYGLMALILSYEFKRVKDYLGDYEVVSVKDMAHALHRSEASLRKSLNRMIRRNMFLQAHLNVESTLFLVTDEQYRQYLEAVELWKEQQKEWDKIGFDEEAHIAIEKARPYQLRIHAAAESEQNSDVKISLEKMEMCVNRLIEAAEKNPDNLSDMHTFLNYFLPTADKLIEEYQKLPVEESDLENVRAMQKEVPEALKKLIDGFEQLSEKLYEQRKIEITSDLYAIRVVMEQQKRLERSV